MVLGNDVTSPVAINEMNKFGKDSIFDKNKNFSCNGPFYSE